MLYLGEYYPVSLECLTALTTSTAPQDRNETKHNCLINAEKGIDLWMETQTLRRQHGTAYI